MPRSTIAIDRTLAQRVDRWAARQGMPSGPGHRTKAVEALIEASLVPARLAEDCDECGNEAVERFGHRVWCNAVDDKEVP